MKEYDIDDQDEAIKRINKGGYKIYSKIDDKMQSYVEEKFKDPNNLIATDNLRRWVDIDGDGNITDQESIPHVAFVALGYDGSVKATVGNWGEKKESLITNYAVTDKRSNLSPPTDLPLRLTTSTGAQYTRIRPLTRTKTADHGRLTTQQVQISPFPV